MTDPSSVVDAPSLEKALTTSAIQDDVAEPGTILFKRGWRFYGTFGSLCLVNLICALDATILANALQVRADSSSSFGNNG